MIGARERADGEHLTNVTQRRNQALGSADRCAQARHLGHLLNVQ